MMKIAYLYKTNSRYSYAAKTVAQGFRNGFVHLGHEFRVFDTDRLYAVYRSKERDRLLCYEPDIILASTEHVNLIPLRELDRHCSLVLWAQFFKKFRHMEGVSTIAWIDKRRLFSESGKRKIIVWSQHSEEINSIYFAGYESQLGLRLIQLLHCADGTRIPSEMKRDLKYDFIWIGNIGHRKSSYLEYIEPLKQHSKAFLEFNENNRIDPSQSNLFDLYSSAIIAPNIHSKAQRELRILLNERFFNISLYGGFQICDNALAYKYFDKNDIVVAEQAVDFIEKGLFFLKHPDLTTPYIENMRTKVLADHCYTNRIKQILTELDASI